MKLSGSQSVRQSMHGQAFVFINFEQAARFGHIGWGFHLGEDDYYFGSTDHLWNRAYPLWHLPELIRYMDVPAHENNDYWAQRGTFDEMMHTMHRGKHVRYHTYKSIQVQHPDPLGAKALADEMRDKGWNVGLNNCVQQSYHILTKYGAVSLPNPKHILLYRFPKIWFAHIEGEAIQISHSAEHSTRHPAIDAASPNQQSLNS